MQTNGRTRSPRQLILFGGERQAQRERWQQPGLPSSAGGRGRGRGTQRAASGTASGQRGPSRPRDPRHPPASLAGRTAAPSVCHHRGSACSEAAVACAGARRRPGRALPAGHRGSRRGQGEARSASRPGRQRRHATKARLLFPCPSTGPRRCRSSGSREQRFGRVVNLGHVPLLDVARHRHGRGHTERIVKGGLRGGGATRRRAGVAVAGGRLRCAGRPEVQRQLFAGAAAALRPLRAPCT